MAKKDGGSNRMNSKLTMQLATVIISLAFGSNALAQSTVLTGTFDANRISYVAADESAKLPVAQGYADVPDTVLFFDVVEGQAVEVDFSASIAAQSEDPLLLRMVLDQNPSKIVAPAGITIRPKTKLPYFSATFLFPVDNGLGPGNHNVRIQWRSRDGSHVVVSTHRTLVVRHN
jgi:hypothetical protein